MVRVISTIKVNTPTRTVILSSRELYLICIKNRTTKDAFRHAIARAMMGLKTPRSMKATPVVMAVRTNRQRKIVI